MQPPQQRGKHGGKRSLIIRRRGRLREKHACEAGTACDDAGGGEGRGGDASHYSISKSRRRRHARKYGRQNRATDGESKYDTRYPHHTSEMAKRSILSPAHLVSAVAVCIQNLTPSTTYLHAYSTYYATIACPVRNRWARLPALKKFETATLHYIFMTPPPPVGHNKTQFYILQYEYHDENHQARKSPAFAVDSLETRSSS